MNWAVRRPFGRYSEQVPPVFLQSWGPLLVVIHALSAVVLCGASVHQAVLATLLLRGPQTAAELRLHAERLHRFADISSVEGFLDEMAAKEPPRVRKLPRAPGAREARWVHLLCGEPLLPAQVAGGQGGDGDGDAASVSAGELAALKAEQARLADELAQLRQWAQRVGAELGIEPP